MLSEYRVKARNTSAHSENKMHDDTVARRYGFRGGLVPGVTVYGYVTHPVVAAWGRAWLTGGGATVRFVKPLFEGEEGVVTASETPDGAAIRLRNPAGEECAVGSVTRAAAGPAPAAADYPVAPPPAERPEGSHAELAPGRVLATTEVLFDEREAGEYLDGLGETHAIYRGADALVHPAYYLKLANRALTGTVKVSPWIHLASDVRHLGAARVGERLAVRGRVDRAYGKKGREMVEMDLLIVAGAEARPVAAIRHTAIWRLAPPPGA